MQKNVALRVLFLSSWYPNRILPKNGNFVRRHAQAVALECEVVSLHVISDRHAKDFEVKVAVLEGVTEVIVYYPKSAGWRPLKKYRMYLEAHRRGYAWIQENWGPVDMTHLNVIYPAGLFALELKKKYGIPYIITEHWTAFLAISPMEFKIHERYFIRRIGESAEGFCPVSEDLKKAFMDFGFAGPYHVIPNVVNTKIFKPAPTRATEPFRLLHVSTFKDDHKNTSGILRVIARLQKERSDFVVTMAGNRAGDHYQSLIKSLGISDEVLKILPVLPIAEIAQMMQENHIFFLFSNYENLPCVIAEAHCTGMVVVGTDVGGTSEMIDDHNGFVVPARNEDTLFDMLNKAIDEYARFDTQNISAIAARRYGYSAVGKAYVEVYHSVLDQLYRSG